MRTVGVEEEFLLVDPVRLDLVARGDAVADAASEHSEGQFEHELKQEQAELGTAPVATAADLDRELRDRRAELAAGARSEGSRLAALGTSPHPGGATATVDRRYAQMAAVFGEVARTQLTCGMHVHVSIDSPAEGVGVLDRIREWWAPLLALSANSPYWQGEDTAYASYRSVVWGRWPTAAIPETFGDPDGYAAATTALITSGAALDEGMIYFPARLSARYPTVELRVGDVCPYVEDATTLALLTRALVSTAATSWRDERPPTPTRGELLRAAMWRASRWGMDGELVDPSTAELRPAWLVVDGLLGHVADAARETGDLDRVEQGLDEIRRRGTGARLQRSAVERSGHLRDAVAAVVERTNA